MGKELFWGLRPNPEGQKPESNNNTSEVSGFWDFFMRPKEVQVRMIGDERHVYFAKEVKFRDTDLIDRLNELSIEDSESPIYIHVFSGGGELFTGMLLHDAIKNLAAPTVAVIDGYAASAATLIALAADKVTITKNSSMMIHQLSSVFGGKYEDFKNEMDLLDRLMNQIVGIYSTKSNISEEDVRSMLSKDTWLSAEQALKLGLVDEIVSEASMKSKSYKDKRKTVAMATNNEELDNGKVIASVEEQPQANNVAEDIMSNVMAEIESLEEVEVDNFDYKSAYEEMQGTINGLVGIVNSLSGQLQEFGGKIDGLGNDLRTVLVPTFAASLAMEISKRQTGNKSKAEIAASVQVGAPVSQKARQTGAYVPVKAPFE